MIKQPFFLFIAVALLVVVAWFVMDRIIFLRTAEKTVGKVTHISFVDNRCGGRKRRHRCTRFTAHVQYVPLAGRLYNMNVSAGDVRGHGQPISRASLQVGSRVVVVYDPKNPAKAYEDSLFGVWGAPLMAFFAQIASLITSLTEPRRRNSRAL